MTAAAGRNVHRDPRCGWPIQLPGGALEHCTLPLGHDGPVCQVRGAGRTPVVAEVPRFGVEGARS